MQNPQFSCNGWQLQQIFKQQQQKPSTNPPPPLYKIVIHVFIQNSFRTIVMETIKYLAVWRNIYWGSAFFVVEILVKEIIDFFIKINKKTKINKNK